MLSPVEVAMLYAVNGYTVTYIDNKFTRRAELKNRLFSTKGFNIIPWRIGHGITHTDVTIAVNPPKDEPKDWQLISTRGNNILIHVEEII